MNVTFINSIMYIMKLIYLKLNLYYSSSILRSDRSDECIYRFYKYIFFVCVHGLTI